MCVFNLHIFLRFFCGHVGACAWVGTISRAHLLLCSSRGSASVWVYLWVSVGIASTRPFLDVSDLDVCLCVCVKADPLAVVHRAVRVLEAAVALALAVHPLAVKPPGL